MVRLQARKWNFSLLHVLKSALELEHNLIYILFISFNIHKLTSGYGWSSVGYLTVCARISRNLFDTQEILRFPLVHTGNYEPELMLLLLFWRSFVLCLQHNQAKRAVAKKWTLNKDIMNKDNKTQYPLKMEKIVWVHFRHRT